MQAVINSGGINTFELNGIQRERVFIALPLGDDSIIIVCVYNSSLVLLPPTNVSGIEINSIVYSTSKEVVESLNPILFTKNIVSPSGSVRSTSTTLEFWNSLDGVVHVNTNNSPLTATSYQIDLASAVEGGMVEIIFSGSSNPAFSGATIRKYEGNIVTQSEYSIYLRYSGGKVNINIFGAEAGTPTNDLIRPATMTITGIVLSNTDVTAPATMSITSVALT